MNPIIPSCSRLMDEHQVLLEMLANQTWQEKGEERERLEMHFFFPP